MVKSAQNPEKLSTPKSKKVAANLGVEIVNALSKSDAKNGVVVPTLDEYAEKEAEILESKTKSRIEIWTAVISAYGNDLPAIKQYPQKVRHAFGKKLGLDFAIPQSEWSEAHQRLYKSFVANQVGPISNMVDWLVSGKTTQGALISFLTGPGTVNEKIKAIPFKKKVRKGANQTLPKVEDPNKPIANPPAGSMNPQIEESVKRHGAVNSALAVVNNSVALPDLCFVLQAIARRLCEAKGEHEKQLGDRIRAALAAYDVATGVKEKEVTEAITSQQAKQVIWPQTGTK